MINNKLPEDILEKYKAENSFPVETDYDNIKKLGVNIFEYRLTDGAEGGYARHNPSRLMRAVYYWFRKTNKEKNKN